MNGRTIDRVEEAFVVVLALTLGLGACSVIIKPGPQPPPRDRQVVVRVSDRGQLVAGATVRVAGGVPAEQQTDAQGGVILKVDRTATDVQLTVTKAGCTELDGTRPIQASGEVAAVIDCTPPPPPKPPVPARATGEAWWDVRANFCNLADESGKPQFTVFLISLDAPTRQQWYQRQRDAGSTHLVLSPQANYPGAPWPSRDLYADAKTFVDVVQEAIETPAADGFGFRPILILDGGERAPRPRIAANWPPIVEELRARGLLDYVKVVPGWELITASDWRSADLSYGLELLHSLGVPHLWLHLSPGRAVGSSHVGDGPVASTPPAGAECGDPYDHVDADGHTEKWCSYHDVDDPWKGAEGRFWYDHGAQYLEGFLYEAKNVDEREDVANCDVKNPDCWLSRWDDVVPRTGAGMNGWRVVRTVLFETVAYGAWHGHGSPEYARDVATAGKALCDRYGVKCGFGNGLPR